MENKSTAVYVFVQYSGTDKRWFRSRPMTSTSMLLFYVSRIADPNAKIRIAIR